MDHRGTASRAGWHAVGLIVLLALSIFPLPPVNHTTANDEPNELSNTPTVLETVIAETSFDTTDGCTHTNMTVPRHSFELVPFRSKLIAYGGVGTFFDPVANQTVTGDTNRTEAYDPVTNSWSPLPNATRALSAYAAEVFNDEIVIHGGDTTSGWSGTASDKTYGYDPFVNRWRTHATLPIGMYDSTLVSHRS